MEKKLFLPTAELAWKAHQEFGRNVQWHPSTPDFQFFKELTVAAAEDVVTGRLNWCRGSNCVDNLLDTLPWFTRNDEVSDGLYNIVEINLVNRIQDMLDELLPYSSWHLWTVNLTQPRGDILIERGDDFRLKDWERLKACYEPNRL